MIAIKVDHAKCGNAAECRKCLELCPVFTSYPLGPFMGAGDGWRINPTIISLCTGCRDCQKVCPAGAITVGR